jgi:hypothetical protein
MTLDSFEMVEDGIARVQIKHQVPAAVWLLWGMAAGRRRSVDALSGMHETATLIRKMCNSLDVAEIGRSLATFDRGRTGLDLHSCETFLGLGSSFLWWSCQPESLVRLNRHFSVS